MDNANDTLLRQKLLSSHRSNASFSLWTSTRLSNAYGKMPRPWPLSVRDHRHMQDTIRSECVAHDQAETLSHTQGTLFGKQQPPAIQPLVQEEQAASSVPKPALECVAEWMIRLGQETSAQIHSHFYPPLPPSEQSSPDSDFDPETAFLTPVRSNSPMSDRPRNINHNLAASHSSSTELCEDCSRNVDSLLAANTLRNAQLTESSVDAMLQSYKKHMTIYPELDAEENRRNIYEYLMAHINEEDGGTLNWERYLEELKHKGVVEECFDEGRIMVRQGSSTSLGKKVRFS
ncbi:MAG: hypothetical protein M1835_001387 [Candelina submexicana]|nr:MAG: hypothetical protein M1835_001387 [Candelina submexicana]